MKNQDPSSTPDNAEDLVSRLQKMHKYTMLSAKSLVREINKQKIVHRLKHVDADAITSDIIVEKGLEKYSEIIRKKIHHKSYCIDALYPEIITHMYTNPHVVQDGTIMFLDLGTQQNDQIIDKLATLTNQIKPTTIILDHHRAPKICKDTSKLEIYNVNPTRELFGLKGEGRMAMSASTVALNYMNTLLMQEGYDGNFAEEMAWVALIGAVDDGNEVSHNIKMPSCQMYTDSHLMKIAIDNGQVIQDRSGYNIMWGHNLVPISEIGILITQLGVLNYANKGYEEAKVCLDKKFTPQRIQWSLDYINQDINSSYEVFCEHLDDFIFKVEGTEDKILCIDIGKQFSQLVYRSATKYAGLLCKEIDRRDQERRLQDREPLIKDGVYLMGALLIPSRIPDFDNQAILPSNMIKVSIRQSTTQQKRGGDIAISSVMNHISEKNSYDVGGGANSHPNKGAAILRPPQMSLDEFVRTYNQSYQQLNIYKQSCVQALNFQSNKL